MADGIVTKYFVHASPSVMRLEEQEKLVAALNMNRSALFGGAPVYAITSHPWQRYLLDPAASTDVDALSESVESVLETIDKDGPAAISLLQLDSTKVQGEHLATILRTTFRWRAQVPGWNSALAIAEAALRREGINPEEALYGLNK